MYGFRGVCGGDAGGGSDGVTERREMRRAEGVAEGVAAVCWRYVGGVAAVWGSGAGRKKLRYEKKCVYLQFEIFIQEIKSSFL